MYPRSGASARTYERLGRYLLLDRIDVGGMAEVFRGRMVGAEGFQRMVALKRILPNIASDPEFQKMFKDEARIAVQLQHANIAQVIDFDEVDETYFIAMEYVSGVSLRTMWDRARSRNRLLPIAMSCHILQKVCEGLDAAHRKRDAVTGEDLGLVHRDVSPQNVLVSFEGEVKIIDFGIAKAANKASQTQGGVLKGKFGYMSPEQVRGVELDNRSDIFACGIMLHELLVGDRLFLGESDFSTLEKIRSGDVTPPTRLNKNLSPQLEEIVMKALSRGREDRYRWAGEMAEELQRYLFATNQPFARTDLQKYMQQHFRKEIGEEKQRMETYRDIEIPVEEPRTEVGPALGSPAGVMPAVVPMMDMAFEPSEPTARGATAMLPLDATPPAPAPAPERGGLPTWAGVLIGSLLSALVLGGAAVWWQLDTGPTTGGLALQVSPEEASVFLDERRVARGGSVQLDGLEPGMHVLEVSAPGHAATLKPVRIESGLVRSLEIRLAAEVGDAGLEVLTEPAGLRVAVDGRDLGIVTPGQRDDLQAGQHRVEVRDGEGRVVMRRTLELHSGRMEKLRLDVEKLPTRLEVRSRPEGAEVRVNGMMRGATPVTVERLPAGATKVEIRKPGCDSATEQVEIVDHRLVEVTASLICPRAEP